MSSTAPSRRFRAPGKLMLAGEHSVLAAGGEALAMAIQAGVEVEARPQPSWELGRAESGLRWWPGQPVPEELRFTHAAWEEACAAVGTPAPHLLVTRSWGSLGTGPLKPGIGGSASSTVATVAAVLALNGRLDGGARAHLLPIALRSHRRAQDGRGSGYDVATVTLGGLVRWRPAGGDIGAAGRTLAWPAGLELVAGYSGRSAPTAALLAGLQRQIGGATLEADRRELAAPVQDLIEAFAEADRRSILAGVRACQAALAEWDSRRGLGLHTPALSRMLELAERAGAAAKVSGAGGGDSAIALAEDRAVLEAVARSWSAEGYLPYWPQLDPRGVEEE